MTERPTTREPGRDTHLPAQLAAVRSELLATLNHAIQLTTPLTDERWRARPDPAHWSIAECLMHLNITSEAFLPRLVEVVDRGWRDGLRGGPPYRRDFWGWLLCRLLEPPYRTRVKTPAAFVPTGILPQGDVMATYERLQRALVDCLQQAAGLDLARLKVASPFAKNTRYHVYSAFLVIAAHQRRHLWQAEQIRKALD